MLLAVVAVAVAGRAGAVSTSLVINEVDYDQPATDAAEFVELKNVSGSATGLDGWSVELFNGSTGALYQTIALPDTSLAAGDYFVICANTATTTNCDLDVAPDTNLIQNGAPDAIGLRQGTTLVDALSYEGDSAPPYTEGSGAGLDDNAASATEGLSRCTDGADTDQNNADFELRAISPGAANDCPTAGKVVVNEIDYDQPGTDAAEFVELRNVSGAATNLDTYTLELVNGSTSPAVVFQQVDLPNVSLADGDYFVICANTATTANCDLDVSPDTNLIQNGAPDAVALRESGTLVDTVSYEGDTAGYTEGSGAGLVDDGASATQGISRCPDGSDTDQNSVDLGLQTITPGAANSCPPPPDPLGTCGDGVETPIHAIQGSGLASPVSGAAHTVEGVVAGDFEGASGLNGFFVQEEDADADADPLTSEGIFVFFPSSPGVQAGDVVRVRGTVTEFNGLTELTTVTRLRDLLERQLRHAVDRHAPVRNAHEPRAARGDAHHVHADAVRDGDVHPRPLRRGRALVGRAPLHSDPGRRPGGAGDRPAAGQRPQPGPARRRLQRPEPTRRPVPGCRQHAPNR